MNIQLNNPYKITPSKHKRYDAHYNIRSIETLIVPTRLLGDEAACDVRWEDSNGELQVLHNIMFANENLIPVSALTDIKLIELWNHYYQPEGTTR